METPMIKLGCKIPSKGVSRLYGTQTTNNATDT
jgi:hypothetical protein